MRDLIARAIIYIRPTFGYFKTKPDRSITIPSSEPSQATKSVRCVSPRRAEDCRYIQRIIYVKWDLDTDF